MYLIICPSRSGPFRSPSFHSFLQHSVLAFSHFLRFTMARYAFAFVALAAMGTAAAQGAAYAQCGGIGWGGATTCVSGYTCNTVNDYYSQCVPGTGGGSPTTMVTRTACKHTIRIPHNA